MGSAPRYAPFDTTSRRLDVSATVRPARVDDDRDVDAVSRLVTGVCGGDPTAWRDRLLRTLHRPGSLLAVAEVDGQVTGYGKAAHCDPVDDADPAPAGRYLTGLVVAPVWRRCGIGEALTHWRLQRIHADHHSAFLITNARNSASIVLHGRLGFVETSRASSYLGEPFDGGEGVLMRCDPPTVPIGRPRRSPPRAR